MRLINLTIDVNSRKVTKYQDLVKIGDALSLSITALNGTSAYDFTGQTVQVFLKKADNTKVEQDATVSGNVINIATMSEQSSAYVGQVEGELLIKDSNGNQITSSTFVYEVEGSVNNEVLVESQNDVQTLDEIQTLIDGYNFNADNLATQNTQATSNISTLTQKNSDAATAQSNLQTVINNANAFASTYNGLSAVQVSVTNLNYKIEAAAELTRDTIPSGFTQLSDLDYTTMSTTPNTIKSLSTSVDSIAYVNGYKIKIPAGTVITLDAPPTSGTRDDLVFLECWKQTDVSGAITWNSRIRVVDGVDFNKNFGSSGGSDGYVGWNNTTDFTKIIPQGGLGSIPSYASIVDGSEVFRAGIYNPSWSPTKFNDTGLWVAGKGNTTQFSTTDGYVYAIPMFRVHRRNSSGYSSNNGNGSNQYYKLLASTIVSNVGSVFAITPSNYDTYIKGKISVGDFICEYNSSNIIGKIIAFDDTNRTITFDYAATIWYTGKTYAFWIKHNPIRTDSLYADIVSERDIIDLRHQVSLTGFNYQQLLEENFDKLLRGELQTNAKTTMLKTYHGIPKTPIDANHVFYASFDGTTTAEVGGALALGTGSFKPMPTGLGYKFNADSVTPLAVSGLSASSGTIDCLVNFNDWVSGTPSALFSLLDSNGYQSMDVLINSTGSITCHGSKTEGNQYDSYALSYTPSKTLVGSHHLRFAWTLTGTIKIYVDGILVASGSYTNACLTPTQLLLGATKTTTTSIFYTSKITISDLSISNIDRGATFATLPQDYIDGYARLSTAFNEQRQTYSDALTSEYKCEQVKASGETKRQYTITQATGGQWTAGDTVKVKGLGGEIITGVIDSDTALATFITNSTGSGTTGHTVILNSVTGISVNDTFKVANSDMSAVGSQLVTVTAIDTTTNTITFSTDSSITDGYWFSGYKLIETTASSSSPLVKATATGTAQAGAVSTITLPTTFNPTDSAYNNLTITITSGTGAGQVRTISGYVGSTKVATVSSAWTTAPNNTSVFSISGVTVNGTWSNLGTNQATFTLGTLYALTTQNIQVEYSLNEVAGQGGISEVLTTTLAGEFSGKKLTVNPSVHLRDDFVGKVVGDTTVNPNRYKTVLNYSTSGLTALLPPSSSLFAYGDNNQDSINALVTLNNTCHANVQTISGQIAQQLFSFDLISIVERKYGTIPALDVAGKVAWLKANIASIKCNWWGYGSCPSGNKAYLTFWHVVNNAWVSQYTNNTASAPSALSVNFTSSINTAINNDGFAYFLAYTDASDGVTASTIYTDYVNIELTFNTPTGYDVLVPENPRRDDGLSNMLLVRKETKEIKSMFGGVSNASGVVTFGDYNPKQGAIISNLVGGNVLTKPKAYATTLTTRAQGMIFNAKTNFDLLNEFLLIDNNINTSLVDGSQVLTSLIANTSYSSLIADVNILCNHIGSKRILIGKIANIGNSYIALEDTSNGYVRYIVDTSSINVKSNYILLSAFICKNTNGEIYIVLTATTNKTVMVLDSGVARVLMFRVTNRPLIK